MQRTNVVTIAVLFSVVHQVSDRVVNSTPECCPDGKTGNACNITCPHCINRVINGICHESCSGGLWGKECHLNCSQRCVKGLDGQPLCDKGTGHCSNGCIQGYYGNTCNKKCSENCDENNCYQMNGTCVKSITGHHGERYDKPNDAALQQLIETLVYWVAYIAVILTLVLLVLCIGRESIKAVVKRIKARITLTGIYSPVSTEMDDPGTVHAELDSPDTGTVSLDGEERPDSPKPDVDLREAKMKNQQKSLEKGKETNENSSSRVSTQAESPEGGSGEYKPTI